MARKSAKKTQAASTNETPAFPTDPTRKKKSQSATSSLKTNGHVARGIGFLKAVVKERKENGEEIICSLGIPTDELEKAFDRPPNRYSAMALEMFLVQKCFTDGLGYSTAVGIHGAFAARLLNRDNDRYAGEYSYDEKQDEVHGCPARAQAVRSVLQAVNTRARSKGASATRNHAEARCPLKPWKSRSAVLSMGLCEHLWHLRSHYGQG